jgi:hypothetical protein
MKAPRAILTLFVLIAATVATADVNPLVLRRAVNAASTCSSALRTDGGKQAGSLGVMLYQEGSYVVMAVFTPEVGDADVVEFGDELLSVNGQTLEGLEIFEAVELLKLRPNVDYTYRVRKFGSREERAISFRVLCTGKFDPTRFRFPHDRANKSLQPTPTAVMPPAAQEIMPAVGVAEH